MQAGRSIYISQSAHETEDVAKDFARNLKSNSILCFFGDLGAGKTTFIRGLAAGLDSSTQVNSPTFTYLNIYDGLLPIYHFDLYRLHNFDEFINMGFDEFLTAGGICCIEWSEKIQKILPPNRITISMTHVSPESRRIEIGTL